MFGKRIAAVGVAALTAVALGACGSGSGGGGGGSSEPYKVGFNSDLSGKYSLNGVGQRDGFKAYFDYVNSQGGINGHQVEVSYLDDASDVTRGTTNTTQLMTAKQVSAVGGYLLSNVCGAAAVLANTHKVPINCSALSDDLLNPVQPYVYTARMVQSEEALPMLTLADQLIESAKPRVAIIIYASAASVKLQSSLEALVKEKGWELVASEQVPLSATDVSAQAAKVVASKPDVVVGSLYDPLAVSFMRTTKAANLDVPFIDYDGATYEGGLLALKDLNFYIFSTFTVDGEGEGPGLDLYNNALKAANVSPTKPFVSSGYAQALSIGEGLKACGFPCSGQQLQAALDKQNVDTGGFASGPLQYSPKSHMGMNFASFYVWDPATSNAKLALENTPAGSGNS
jgi:ABC-type branched-subunit amino acid transport system substrate-binding protein